MIGYNEGEANHFAAIVFISSTIRLTSPLPFGKGATFPTYVLPYDSSTSSIQYP